MTAESQHEIGHLISLLALDCRTSGRDDLKPFLAKALRALDHDANLKAIKDAYLDRGTSQDAPTSVHRQTF